MSPDATLFTQLSGGSATLAMTLPVNPAFVGITMHAQGFVADSGANAAGAVASNSGRVVTGTF